MRKELCPVLVIMVFALNACAQKIDAAKVPDAVKTSFTRQHPGVNPKWEKEDGKYEASFKINGNAASATFDTNGTFEENELEIKVADLPQTIHAYVKEHYKGKSIKEAAKITLGDGSVNYEAELKGKNLIFDATGKFLKELKD